MEKSKFTPLHTQQLSIEKILSLQAKFILENNPKLLPIIKIDNNWIEGSYAKYYIENYIGHIDGYAKFIRMVRKMYTNSKVCFIKNTGIIGDYRITLEIGKII